MSTGIVLGSELYLGPTIDTGLRDITFKWILVFRIIAFAFSIFARMVMLHFFEVCSISCLCYGTVGVMLSSQHISTVKATEYLGWIGLVLFCSLLL